MKMRRFAITGLLGLAMLAMLAGSVHGQDKAAYPERAITFLVPFGAGSATDQLARALGVAVAERSKQPVVVENKGGASGMLAAAQAARAAPDGYTVLITTNTTQAANLHLYKKLPYDPFKDFQPVTALGRGGQVLVVSSSSELKSVSDLVAKARKEPAKLTFGAGNSSSRIAGEMLKQLSGTDVLYVPYKSNPAALIDLLGGRIDFMVIDTVTGLPQIEVGKLRPLGVSTANRLALLPSVPTINEAGVKGYDIGYWFAAYVPVKTPAPVVARIRELLIEAVNSQQAKQFFEPTGTERWTTTTEELSNFQIAEGEKWGRIIKAANIEPE